MAHLKKISTLISAFLLYTAVNAQCQLNDGDGNASANPVYIGCSHVTSVNDTDFVIVITPSNNFGAWTMTWGDGTTSSGTSLIPPANINHTYISRSGGVYADTFNFTFVSGTCTIPGIVISGYPVTANIEVPGGLTQLSCAPGTLDFINNSNGASGLPIMPGTTFSWEWGDGSPVQVEPYTNAGDTVSHTYQRNTVNCVTQVDLTATNACNLSPSVNSQSPVLIYDLDDAAIAASATILCYPDTVVNFANGSNFNCYAQGNTDQRYEWWNFGDYWGKGYDSIVNWRPSGPPLGTPAPNPIPIAFPGIGTYTVNMIDSNFCGQDPAAIQIQIVAPPTADVVSDDTICSGETVTFQNLSSVGANVFAWDFDDGNGFQNLGGGNQNYTFNIPGTYVVRLAVGIAGANCQDTASWTIVVLPSPVANIGLDNQSGCDSLTVNFTDSSQGTIVTWAWDFDNGQTSNSPTPPQQFYGFPANFTVGLTVTNNFGCSDQDQAVINVYQTPIPDFTPNSVCVNALAQFNDSSLSASGDPIISWAWDFGDGSGTSTIQNPTYTYTTAGTYNVILSVATANCAATDTISVVAEELPTSVFSVDTTQGCSPLTVNFTNNSSANSARYFWIFGDGDTTSQVSPSHTYNNNFGFDTTYRARLIAYTNFGCADTSLQPIIVYPNPVAAFTDSSLPVNCSPAIVAFRNFSSNGATSFLWDFGAGKTSTLVNPRDTFVNNSNFLQTKTITLVAYSVNGCTDTTSGTILVFPKPAGLPDTVDSGCAPLTVQFPAVTNAVSYLWDFGDLSPLDTNSAPSHTYFLPDSNIRVQLITQSAAGCRDTSYSTVKVYPNPNAQFSIGITAACAPVLVNFTNLSAGGTNFHWDFRDGSTLDTTFVNVSHVYQNTGTSTLNYQVQLTAENQFGCTSIDSMPFAVYPEVAADFTHDSVGCSPLGVLFTNTSSSGASDFGWIFSDGVTSSQQNPARTFINSGIAPDTIDVQMIASSPPPQNCLDTAYSRVIVFPSPNANFSVNPPSNTLTYPDTVFTINNLDLNWRALWDWGDGTSSDDSIPGTKAYSGWGNWTIKLVTYNAFCRDSAEDVVTILPPLPLAEFGDSTEGCEDLFVTFENRSKYATDYKWTFTHATTNAKQSSVEKNPEVAFTDPGTYNILLEVRGEGGDAQKFKAGYITVYEQPRAIFTFAPEEVYIPNEAVVFFNNSRGDNLTYSWNFGDGNTSNQENPEHYYQAEGEYLVTLVATNSFCADTFVSFTPVEALASGDLQTPNAFTPNTGGDPGVDGGYDFSRGGLNVFDNDVFLPKITGEVKKYEFMIFNKWGELLFRTTKPTVGWTGWYRNQLCQQDVYVYKVNATMIDNSEKILVGDLTLLR